MIQSMTGFGKAEVQLDNQRFNISIRSVNSKNLDLNFRMPQQLREKENVIRKILQTKLNRGKVDVSIYLEQGEVKEAHHINSNVLSEYISQLRSASSSMQVSDDQLMAIASRLPNVMSQEEESYSGEDWKKIEDGISSACEALNAFRSEEGLSLKKDIEQRIQIILDLMQEIEPFESERMETVKARLNKQLLENGLEDKINMDRFEQELIFYLEKMDITEEKVRLRSHCDLFSETMEGEEHQGRKLGFISQELGREINTIGSKANHAGIQKCVVQMKDELEKIKEQLFNIL